MGSQDNKGISKELSTFLKWGIKDIVDYKTIEVCNKTQVTFIWCKLCAKHKKAPGR